MQTQTDPFSDAGRGRPEVLESCRPGGPSPGAAFDDVVRLAADLVEVPAAPVSSAEGRRQRSAARVGFDAVRPAAAPGRRA